MIRIILCFGSVWHLVFEHEPMFVLIVCIIVALLRTLRLEIKAGSCPFIILLFSVQDVLAVGSTYLFLQAEMAMLCDITSLIKPAFSSCHTQLQAVRFAIYAVITIIPCLVRFNDFESFVLTCRRLWTREK